MGTAYIHTLRQSHIHSYNKIISQPLGVPEISYPLFLSLPSVLRYSLT